MLEGLNRHTVRVQKTIELALKLGFPITCATCDFLHQAWDSNADDCGKTDTCGGPIFGKSFPDYRGYLKREDLDKLCLICGSRSVDYLVVVGDERLGLCRDHGSVFDSIVDVGVTKPLIVVSPTSRIRV